MKPLPTPSIDDRLHGISTLILSSWPDFQSSASGFFFQRLKKDDPKPTQGGSAQGYRWVQIEELWLITNRHVLISDSNLLASSITFHLRKAAPSGIEWMPITLSGSDLRDRCKFHKSAGIDVAAVRILDLIGPSMTGLPENEKALSFTSTSEDDFPAKDKIAIGIGDDAMVVGYPRGFYDNFSKYPIVKSGIIASRWNSPFDGEHYFLIDAKLFPGSSGSIVISRPTEFQFRDGHMFKSSSGAKQYAFLGVFSGEPYRVSHPIETEGFTIISKEGYNVGIVWYYYLIPQVLDDGIQHST